LDKWLKIEEAINRLIALIQGFIKKTFSTVMPAKLKKEKLAKEKATASIPRFDPTVLIAKAKKLALGIKDFFINLILKVKSYISTIKNVGTSPSGKFKRRPKLKEVIIVAIPFLIPLLLKAKNWYVSLKPTTLLLVTVTSSVGVITGVEVYKSTMGVVEEIQEEKVVIIKESKKEKKKEKKKRPDYYKNQEKQLLVSAVAVPVYIEKVTSIKSLIIDFTLVTSNRYLKQFFFENEYLIKDRLNTTVRPVIPEFPLSNEGKHIIREKIRNEMNTLIKEWKIKGKIESVHFHNIIAS